jgi:MerR family transcriptional regulator, redox-sensitive transcriptional activator SoxR
MMQQAPPIDRSRCRRHSGHRVSRWWRRTLDARIDELERLRDDLTSCIGCGCLSLRTCRLFNTADAASSRGAGPRYLLGDDPEEVVGHQV